MSDLWRNRLSEYLDGDLEPEEARGLERHLNECATCRRELELVRRVVERLDAAPDREPPEDLWPTLAQRIATTDVAPEPSPPVRRWLRSTPRMAAALAGVAVLGSAWMWLGGRTQPNPPPRLPVEATSLPKADEEYERAAAAWQQVLVEETLPPELVEPVLGEIAAFDRAIDETRRALAEDPVDADLEAHLTRLLRARMRFVSRVEGYAGEES